MFAVRIETALYSMWPFTQRTRWRPQWLSHHNHDHSTLCCLLTGRDGGADFWCRDTLQRTRRLVSLSPATCHETARIKDFQVKYPPFLVRDTLLPLRKLCHVFIKIFQQKCSDLNTVAKINVVEAKQRDSVQVKSVYLLTCFWNEIEKGWKEEGGWLKWKHCSWWSELGTQDPGWTAHNHL